MLYRYVNTSYFAYVTISRPEEEGNATTVVLHSFSCMSSGTRSLNFTTSGVWIRLRAIQTQIVSTIPIAQNTVLCYWLELVNQPAFYFLNIFSSNEKITISTSFLLFFWLYCKSLFISSISSYHPSYASVDDFIIKLITS